MVKKILAILLIASNVYADCEAPVKVAKGAAAPCPGYIFSEELETKIRIDLVHKDKVIENLTKVNQVQENIIKIDAEQLKIYEDKLKHEQNFGAWEKALYFGMGAALTGLVAYGAVRAVR